MEDLEYVRSLIPLLLKAKVAGASFYLPTGAQIEVFDLTYYGPKVLTPALESAGFGSGEVEFKWEPGGLMGIHLKESVYTFKWLGRIFAIGARAIGKTHLVLPDEFSWVDSRVVHVDWNIWPGQLPQTADILADNRYADFCQGRRSSEIARELFTYVPFEIQRLPVDDD